MEQLEVKRLRKKQYRNLNLAMLLAFGTAILIGDHITSRTGFLLLFFCVLIAATLEAYGFFTGRYIATKDTKKLLAYEKEQLGAKEFRKEKRMTLIAQVFVCVAIGIQFAIAIPNTPFMRSDFAWYFAIIILIMTIMMNWSMRSRAKRIDTNQPAKGKDIRKNNLKIAFITGAVVFLTSLILLFVMISMI